MCRPVGSIRSLALLLALVAGFYVRRTRRADAGDIASDKVVGPVGRALSLVGRMALTCYIGQNLIASIIFYQWGFGVADMIAGQWYTYWTLLIYLGIAALLIAFSALIGYFIWETKRAKPGD